MPSLSGTTVEVEALTGYETAFEYFSEKVRTLQLLGLDPDITRTEIKAAILEVEKARISYNRARDAMARQLLDSPPERVKLVGFGVLPTYTSEVAKLIWEYAGKPEGTAEDDWYSAEEIIRLTRK